MLATLKQTAELVEFFRTHGLKQTFRKGDFIIRPGDSPPGVFYIYQGLVKAYDITKYNEENLLIIRKRMRFSRSSGRSPARSARSFTRPWRRLLPGSSAASLSWISSVQARGTGTAARYDHRDVPFAQRAHLEPGIPHRPRANHLFPADHEPALWQQTADGLLIEVPLRHQDIASSVNATRETTSREISALERKGLLENKQS